MMRDLAKKSFLIVDDYNDMRGIIKHMLTAYGVTDVDLVANGEEAMNKIAERNYDVILCDYNLGNGKDGQQVFEEAKYKKILPFSTIFIMITAENTMKMVMGVIEFYPDDYLSKPINKETLKKRIEKLILRKQDLNEVTQLIEKEQFTLAIDKCQQHIDNQPRNVTEFIKLKAELYTRLGQYNDAEQVYKSALAERDLPWAQFGLGKICFLKGEFNQACDWFEQLIQSTPNHMESYDWLAKSRLQLGDQDRAKQTLSEAVNLSPKVTSRQAFLGNVALECEDFKTAERAFRSATAAGNRSIFNTPTNYTKLANATLHTRSPKDVLKVLNKIKNDFPHDKNARIQAEISKSLLLKDSLPQIAKESIATAKKLYEKQADNLDTEILLEMSKALYSHDDDELAEDLLNKVVMNYSDNIDKLETIKTWMINSGREDQARDIITVAKRKVIKLNNDARDLANKGDLISADKLLEDALKQSPDNITINLNCIRVILALAKDEGITEHSTQKLMLLFDKVRDKKPGHKDLPELMEKYQTLLGNNINRKNCA